MSTLAKPVTQKHIAQKLGVSHQLVGLALNGHAAVSDQTREKIIATAKELGYDRFSNREARSLIARRYGKRVLTGVVAVIVPQVHEGTLRNSPYYPAMLDGIENEANNRGLDVLICTARQQGLPRLVQAREVDGVIYLGGYKHAIDELVDLDLAVVNLDRDFGNCHSLVPDNRSGMALAVDYLIGLGHTRIAYIGHPPDDQSPGTRLQGYRDALAGAGLAVDENLVEATSRSAYAQGGIEGLQALLSRTRDFTAVACYNDTIAMGAVKEARDSGMRVPEDLSVTGFDDLSADFHFEPFITSVRFCRHEMGRRAVELISRDSEAALEEHEAVEHGAVEHEHVTVPVELAIRSSAIAV